MFGWLRRIFGNGTTPPGKNAPDGRWSDGCRWSDPPALLRREAVLTRGGEPERYANPIAYAMTRWGGKLPRMGLRALAIGAPDDPPLIDWLRNLEGVSEVVALEADPGMARRLRERATPGVRVVEALAGLDPMPRGPFHVAASWGELGRLADLEPLADALRREMVPGGLLVAREYVGPNRYQFDDRQMALANAMLVLIPESRRLDAAGLLRERQDAPELWRVMATDSRAGIRSEDVAAVIRGSFGVCEEAALGGTVLAPILGGIAHRFLDGRDEAGGKILTALSDAEMSLVNAGLLASDYWFVVAWNRRCAGAY